VDQNFDYLGADSFYTLPATNDPDSSSVTISLGTEVPSFIDLNSPNEIRIKPKDAGVT
jgi:hypothetical protein